MDVHMKVEEESSMVIRLYPNTFALLVLVPEAPLVCFLEGSDIFLQRK